MQSADCVPCSLKTAYLAPCSLQTAQVLRLHATYLSATFQTRIQTGWPIWEHFVQYADWTKRLQIGQNAGRWDVPVADIPSADWAKCSHMGPFHLPTARLQIGQNVATWDRSICRRPVCRWDDVRKWDGTYNYIMYMDTTVC